MVDIKRAMDFMQQHGSPVHMALARYALGYAGSQDVLEAIAPLQREDGGWTGTDPDCPPSISTVSCSWLALQWLRWISADNTPQLDRTAAYLAKHQHEEGYWDESNAIRSLDAPPWMQPGKRANRIWLTAAVSRMLMETGHETEVFFGRALNYLSNAWDDGVLHDPQTPSHPLWMMLPLFKIGGQPSDEHIVEGCNRLLIERISDDKLDPMDVISVAHAAINTRYAGNRLYILARDKALTYQQKDGGWTTHYGDQHRPGATMDALMLLRLGGML